LIHNLWRRRRTRLTIYSSTYFPRKDGNIIKQRFTNGWETGDEEKRNGRKSKIKRVSESGGWLVISSRASHFSCCWKAPK
jgi:hypothetical protein